MTTAGVNSHSISTKKQIPPIYIIGALFFIFGFVTWLNGTLIPFLKISCELNNFQAYFVTFAFYISYFVMAPPSSFVLYKVGFKNGIALGLFVMAIGSLVFIPAAMTRTFGLFLTGLFVQGAGLALLQTASNPYVALIGPYESAAKRISIMGICNKVAGVLSPLILGAIVLKGANRITEQLPIVTIAERNLLLDSLANRVIMPYIIIAIVLTGLSFLVKYTHLPEVETDLDEVALNSTGAKKNSLWQFPHLILGFIAIFVYVGVEVIAGDTIILYGQSQGISLEIARRFTSYTLAAMVIGYILGIIAIPKYISQSRALALSAILGVGFAFLAIVSSGFASVLFIALLGLANAIMWPAIWPLAIANLGKFTKSGSALLIMGIAGGATIPLLYGRLADIWGSPQQAYWIMIPFYMYILYYAIWGHKLKR
jgi:FHS family L-fucose permease-like MFS transporter